MILRVAFSMLLQVVRSTEAFGAEGTLERARELVFKSSALKV